MSELFIAEPTKMAGKRNGDIGLKRALTCNDRGAL